MLHRRRRRIPDDASELTGEANRLRLERLGARLAELGPLAVRQSLVRRGGRRLVLDLDDGTVLTLQLFWDRRGAVAAIESVWWDDRIGWVVIVLTAAGERRTDYAWRATLEPAEAVRSTARNDA